MEWTQHTTEYQLSYFMNHFETPGFHHFSVQGSLSTWHSISVHVYCAESSFLFTTLWNVYKYQCGKQDLGNRQRDSNYCPRVPRLQEAVP
ncbi:hypothetical protein C0J52_07369 [Blattella germanica]|nr:hypothetical protein C0J52_07369 [Blattella germanica]